ncbi:hypothetical protein ACLOJK_022335, partial [Asimina triloba]
YTISHGPPEHRNSVLHHLPKELPWRLTSSPSGNRSAADVRPPAASNDPASTHHAQILATNAQTPSDGIRAGDATIVRTNPLNQISAQPMQWLDPADASSGSLQQQRPSSNADRRQPVAHPINGIRPSSRRSMEPIQDPGASIGSRLANPRAAPKISIQTSWPPTEQQPTSSQHRPWRTHLVDAYPRLHLLQQASGS